PDDGDERAGRELEVDAFQVVGAGAAEAGRAHGCYFPGRVASRGRVWGSVVIGACLALSTPAAAQGGERWLERAETLAERGRTRPAMAMARRAARALSPADPRPALALAAMLPDEPAATLDAAARALATEVI